MDARTLQSAMSYRGYPAPLTLADYAALVPEVSQALRDADCTTVERAAMFLAQIGAESGSLRWMEELADGSAYNGRADLGNTEPGDGPRFKGRGPIQVTGRHNYGVLSKWAHKNGYVPTATFFVDNPAKLALPKYRWLGAVWYWIRARNMNGYADARDISGATRAVNGGYNNLSGRTARWLKCLSLGDAILPTTHTATTEEMMATRDDEKKIRAIVADEVAKQLAGLDKHLADQLKGLKEGTLNPIREAIGNLSDKLDVQAGR